MTTCALLCRPAVEAYTPQALVWASDWPFLRAPSRVDYGPLLALLAQQVPDDAARRLAPRLDLAPEAVPRAFRGLDLPDRQRNLELLRGLFRRDRVGHRLDALFENLGIDGVFLHPLVDRRVEIENIGDALLHRLDVPLLGITARRAGVGDDRVHRLGAHRPPDRYLIYPAQHWHSVAGYNYQVAFQWPLTNLVSYQHARKTGDHDYLDPSKPVDMNATI